MREELTDTKRWRASIQKYSQRSQGWASQRLAHKVELDAEIVDAALTEDLAMDEMPVVIPVAEQAIAVKSDATDIIHSLTSQLDLLEKQRVQLQMLLKKAQAND